MSSPSSKPSCALTKYALPIGAALATASAAFASYQYVKKAKATRQVHVSNPKEMEQFPVIDLAKYLNKNASGDAAWLEDCKQIARLLYQYGILIIQDPRVQEKDNEVFLDLLEQYYAQPAETLQEDARPELGYQVGVTPQRIERARNHCDRVKKLAPQEKPLTPCPPEVDRKSRFFWRMGERPKETKWAAMNMPSVLPKAFPQWESTMNNWGNLMLQSLSTVAEMAAVGFDLPSRTFTDLMKFGPHLLAPTASDLKTEGQLGNVFASYHYDLNFLTIHGRSRFPGLYIWTRDGKKMLVKVPPKCLLLQAGKQFEWLTGGEVLAGFHEVVVTKETLAAVERAKADNKSLWRISSTLFGHIASDNVLEPLPKFRTPENVKSYPPTEAGQQVLDELKAIELAGVNGMV